MTQTTASPDDQPLATANARSAAALDLAEQQLRACLAGRTLSDDARAGISFSLAIALRELAALEAAAEPGSDEEFRAAEGLQRFHVLLEEIAEAGLLPGR